MQPNEVKQNILFLWERNLDVQGTGFVERDVLMDLLTRLGIIGDDSSRLLLVLEAGSSSGKIDYKKMLDAVFDPSPAGAIAACSLKTLTPAQYIEKLQKGEDDVDVAQLVDLRARLCYGSQPSDFLKLGHPLAKTCFVMGPDGLHLLLIVARGALVQQAGPSVPMDALLKIGYDVLYIYNNIRQGRITDLVVFPRGDVRHESATWEGVARLLAPRPGGIGAFPRAAPVLARHAAELRACGSEPFCPQEYMSLELEYREWRRSTDDCAAPQKFEDDMPWLGAPMTEEALCALGGTARPCHSRAFLCHFCGMNSLFGGDGYTLPEGCVRHVMVQNPDAIPLYWPEDGGSPMVTTDSQGVKQGERVVRVLPYGLQQSTIVSLEMDMPSTPATLTLVGPGTLQEYLAENSPRMDIKGLRSTPIGSPTLEACCDTIVRLFDEQQKVKNNVKDKGQFAHLMGNNWVEEGPSTIDPATGALTHGELLHWTPDQFAKAFVSGEVLPSSVRLDGVGFRFRRIRNGPVGGDQLANPRGANPCEFQDTAVLIDGPAATQKLLEREPRTCLELMLSVALSPSLIYQWVTEGHGFILEIVQWKPWSPDKGNDPSCMHFPSTTEGVRAFLHKEYPEVLASFNAHCEHIVNNSPDLEELAAIDNNSKSTPMTYDRFKELLRLDKVGSLQVRMFINDSLTLCADWHGSPAYYGINPDDAAYLFIAKNQRVSELRARGLIASIPMGSPGAEEVMQRICKAYKDLRDRAA